MSEGDKENDGNLDYGTLRELGEAGLIDAVLASGTKEGYLFREIFEELFPHESAIASVPGGKSIACSSPAAIAWDAAFESEADPSGRAVGVHDQSYLGPKSGSE